MTSRLRRLVLMLGLGVAAGAVLQQPAQAQVDTTRAKRDSIARRDSLAKTPLQKKDTAAAVTVPVPKQADSLLTDSLRKRAAEKGGAVPLPARKDTIPKDTIKAPIAHAEAPPPLTASDTYIWDRNAIYATGAFTAQDLLDRVPGITGFRSGWIAAPQTAAYLGDVGRVRVFLDGVELDRLDSRMGGSLDLTQIQLWPLEEVRIERGASEVRMYLRTWRVDRTTPSTRTDVSTGDQQTNMYRGYFGRRYGGGELLQAGAQQYGTTPGFTGAASDQTSLMGRVGWARKGFSVDGFMLRTSRHRGTIYSALVRGDSLPGIESTQSQAYLRAGWGDPDNGPWAQAIASTQSYQYTGTRAHTSFGAADTAAAETTFVEPQYVLTGGFTKWGIQLSGAERLRSLFGNRLGTPEVRASYTSRMLALMAYSEGRSADSIARTELSARVSPLSFISLSGAVGHNTDHRLAAWHLWYPLRDTTRTASYERAEVGVRFKRLWVSGGMLHRDRVMLNAPIVYDSVLRRVMDPAANAAYAAIRGNFYEDLYADITALRWSDTAGFYRPRYQTRTEVGIRTSWLSKFPSGNFGLHFAAIHEYRSNTWFPADTGSAVVPGSRTISSLLEIRILSAVAFFEMRNMLGERYALVPRFQMPRQTTMYGVRWEFWN